MSSGLLIYGAGGYMGRLSARHAAAAGLEPILAGRRAGPLAAIAAEIDAPTVVAPIADLAGSSPLMGDVKCVLNCAGPFSRTSGELARACIDNGVAYLDLAGEVDEFEALLRLDESAIEAGSMLMPGVGFGVVPTDCLAVRLHERLPSASRLRIGFQTLGGVSRGTAAVVFGDLHTDGVQRRVGRLVKARPAEATLEVDLGDGPTTLVTNPWRADLISAHRSTGIPEIETYIAMPAPVRLLMRRSRQIGPLWRSNPWQHLLGALIGRMPEGPSEDDLQRGSTLVWAAVDDPEGKTAECRLRGPEAYLFSALTAVEVARRALVGDAPPGFMTPAGAYGPGLVESIPGVQIDDLPSGTSAL